MRAIYGDLANQPRFGDAFARWLRMIHAEGVEAALTAYAA
jgi:mannitol 2-dehydrogenase